MPDDKRADRLRRKKRRGQQEREKAQRRRAMTKAAVRESKATDETEKLNRRIAKLVDAGYSIESVSKRLGVTARRINSALDAIRRQ